MSQQFVLINGAIVPKESATIGITDLSIQRGFGIFDFFKTIAGEPVLLEDHLDRLYDSAKEMMISLPFTRESLKGSIRDLMQKNLLPDSGIRITVTGGYSADGYSAASPNVLVTQSMFKYNKELFDKGCRLVTYEHQRQLPMVKTIDYLQAIRLQGYIKEKQADDVLYLGKSGVAECPRCNFFMVNRQNELLTPKHNVLYGITRKQLLKMEGFDIIERNIEPEELLEIKEAFITSTTKMILPVLAINGIRIGEGKPGPITKDCWRQLLLQQGLE
jgi:branched-chain amino acid aminotransferase